VRVPDALAPPRGHFPAAIASRNHYPPAVTRSQYVGGTAITILLDSWPLALIASAVPLSRDRVHIEAERQPERDRR
jgi:hypothetical protein